MARELSIVITADTGQAEQALRQTESALKAVEKAADGADAELKDVEKTAGVAKDAMGVLDKSLAGVSSKFAALGRGGAIAAVGAALLAAVRPAAQYAESIADGAKSAGVAIDAYQKLDFIAGRNHTTFDALGKAMFDLDVKLSRGAPNVVAAVGAMGQSVDDLLALSRDDRFRAVAKALTDIADPAEQSRLAFELFGDSARVLLPVLSDIAKGADEAANVLDDELVEAGSRFEKFIDSATAKTAHFTKTAGLGLVQWVVEAADGWYELAQAIGLVSIKLDAVKVPPRPGLWFETPATANAPIDPLQGNSMGFWERRLTQQAQEAIRQNAPRASNVLPFVRPSLMGELQGYSLAQAQMFNGVGFPGMTGGFPGLSFPGFAPGPLAALQNLNFGFGGTGMGTLAPTIGMNRPGVSGGGGFGGFMRSTGGRIAGVGMGMLSGMIPGMSGAGSSIGATAGGMLGSIGSIASTALGPLLGPLGGIVGGLVGKLFGPKEGQKTNRARDAAISADFGSVDALRDAAERAGFSVDKLLSTKKVADFEKEYEKLKEAIADTDADTARVGEAMERWGLTIQDMGPKFQQSKINETFKDALDDIRVLTNAGADFNTVAEKMAPTLGGMVQEAIEMGGTVPREMEPILKKMIELGLLTDKNGDKFTELGQIPFAADLNKDFTVLIGKMDALITKISQLPGLFDDAADSANNLANVAPGADPGPGSADPATGFDQGGIAGRTWRQRSMRDVIPAWLRPGELVVTPEQQRSGGVSIGNLVVNSNTQNRAQFVQDVGEAVVSYYERRGRRVA